MELWNCEAFTEMDFQFETKHFIVNAEERIGPIMDLETFCIIETNWAFVQRSAKFMCKVNERDKLHLELFSSFLQNYILHNKIPSFRAAIPKCR